MKRFSDTEINEKKERNLRQCSLDICGQRELWRAHSIPRTANNNSSSSTNVFLVNMFSHYKTDQRNRTTDNETKHKRRKKKEM